MGSDMAVFDGRRALRGRASQGLRRDGEMFASYLYGW
jgi:hypothetical protein